MRRKPSRAVRGSRAVWAAGDTRHLQTHVQDASRTADIRPEPGDEHLRKLTQIFIVTALIALATAFSASAAETERAIDGQVLEFAEGNPVDLAWAGKHTSYSNDPTSKLLVLDARAATVSRYALDGTLEARFGSQGSGPGQFRSPQAIATSLLGNIYVADTGNDRIQVFDAKGNLLQLFGRSGIDPGELRGPRGIAFAADIEMGVRGARDVIVVSDTGNDRIQVFTEDGKPIGQASIPMPLAMEAVSGDGVVVINGRSGTLYSAYGLDVQPFDPLEHLLKPAGLQSPVDFHWFNDYYVADASGQLLIFERASGGHSIVGHPTRHSRTIKAFDPPPRAVVFRDSPPLKPAIYVADGRRVIGLKEIFDDPMQRFEEFRQHLAAGNARAAQKYMDREIRATHKKIYAAAGRDGMKEMAARMERVTLAQLDEHHATMTCYVIEERDGRRRPVPTFSLRWSRDFLRRWIIYEILDHSVPAASGALR
jgi:hypothetical protein